MQTTFQTAQLPLHIISHHLLIFSAPRCYIYVHTSSVRDKLVQSTANIGSVVQYFFSELSISMPQLHRSHVELQKQGEKFSKFMTTTLFGTLHERIDNSTFYAITFAYQVSQSVTLTQLARHSH